MGNIEAEVVNHDARSDIYVIRLPAELRGCQITKEFVTDIRTEDTAMKLTKEEMDKLEGFHDDIEILELKRTAYIKTLLQKYHIAEEALKLIYWRQLNGYWK